VKTSIVIPVHNGRTITARCIESVRANTPEDHELIVVDDGSRPRTADYLKDANIDKLIRNENARGFQSAVNQGWEAASGDYLCTINNDTIAGPGWLAGLLETLLTNEEVGVTGRFGGFVKPDYTCFHQEQTWKREVDYIEASCWLFPRPVYEKVGAFDPELAPVTCDDTDLSIRIRREGYRVVCTPGVDFKHLVAQTNGQTHHGNFEQLWNANKQKLVSRYGPWETVMHTHLPVTLFAQEEPPQFHTGHAPEYMEQWPMAQPPARVLRWEKVIVGEPVDLAQATTDWVLVLKKGETIHPFVQANFFTLVDPGKDGWVLPTPEGQKMRLFRLSRSKWDADKQEAVDTTSKQAGLVTQEAIINAA
jgi:GT2 family glycosyltransferase